MKTICKNEMIAVHGGDGFFESAKITWRVVKLGWSFLKAKAEAALADLREVH